MTRAATVPGTEQSVIRSGWRIQLLGGLRAERGRRTITRFDTQKTAALFAYLAYPRRRPALREELVELLWPGGDPDAGRTSLRTALASLRRQLEPEEVDSGSVLIADRQSVCLSPDAIATDVAAFEQARRAADATSDPAERRALLEEAVALYQGELLPGHSESWVLVERERLSDAFVAILCGLAELLADAGEAARAVETARRAVQAGRLDETAHYTLIRLYAATGEPVAAKRQYRELERLLREEFDERPSLGLEALLPVQPLCVRSPEPCRATDGQPFTDDRRPTSGLQAPSSKLQVTRNVEPGAGNSPRRPVAPSGIPVPLTTFHGREAEIAQVGALLAAPETRLLTLTGLGGTGKTRLAIAVARAVEAAGEWEVCFVSLAEVTDPGRLLDAIAAALHLPASSENGFDPLTRALDGRPFLLILDNFEQLVEGGAQSIRALLARLPRLRILVTSRVPLGLMGEREYPVPPLPVPLAPATPERLLGFSGVRLFVERAQAVRPEFAVTTANAEAIAQLCHALDGIPLALELAAARAGVLTPGQMHHHLARRFDFLVGRHRDVAERHRTLRAVMEWSVQSLSETHQRLLARLSVFRGSWTMAAAEAVCAEPALLDLTLDLRDASLLIADEAEGEMRFRMLETVRAYAVEALEARGESDLVGRRHRDYYLQVALEARSHLHGPEQAAWFARLEREHDNLRAALAWCAETSDGGEAGLQFVVALDSFWDLRGHFREGREECLRALGHPGAQAPTKTRASALNTAATFAQMHWDGSAARAHLEEALAILRAHDDRRGIAWTLMGLGCTLRGQGAFREARQLLGESLAGFRALGAEDGARSALANLAYLAQLEGSLEEARALHEEVLAIKRAQGDRQSIAASLDNLGKLYRVLGDSDRARALWEESLAIRREIENRWGIASALVGLGLLARDRGDYDDAICLFEESLSLLRQLEDRPGIAAQQGNLALVYCLRGDLPTAHTLSDQSLALRRELGEPNGIAEALAICAVVATAQGRAADAVRLWQESDTHRAGEGHPPTPLGPVARRGCPPASRVAAAPADRDLFERYRAQAEAELRRVTP